MVCDYIVTSVITNYFRDFSFMIKNLELHVQNMHFIVKLIW